jgi:hypothetical protein
MTPAAKKRKEKLKTLKLKKKGIQALQKVQLSFCGSCRMLLIFSTFCGAG